MDGTGFWIAATLAAFCVGMGKGGLPVVAMLSVPILSQVISPLTAAGLLLPVYIASDMFGLYVYRRDFNRQVLLIVMVALTLGTGVGWATAHVVSEPVVTLLIGLIGTAFALNTLRPKPEIPPRPVRWGPGLFWGTVAGFTSFVSHAGGPPFQIYTLPLKMPKLVFAGTSTIAFAYTNLLKVVPYHALGQLPTGNLRIAAILSVPAILGVFVGFRLVNRLPEKLFFRIVVWALLLVSLRLIYVGLTGR